MKKSYTFSIPTLAFLLACHGLFAQSPDRNWVKTTLPTIPTKSDAEFNALEDSLKDVTVQYLDGLGKPLQTVRPEAAPSGKDLVEFFEYDAFGRQTREYLPYAVQNQNAFFRPQAVGEQAAFYQTAAQTAHTAFPYREKEFEPSPLDRVKRQGGLGEYRQLSGPYTLKSSLRVCAAGELPRFRYDAPSGQVVFDGYFGAHDLLVETLRTEHEGKREDYKSASSGRTILSREEESHDIWASTYFVYDAAGALRLVIQAEGYKMLEENGWNLIEEIRELYCFTYDYDGRGRLTEKKAPSREKEEFVYDRTGLPVLTRDAGLRAQQRWKFLKYDGLDRVVIEGLYTDPENRTRAQLQTLLDGLPPQFEKVAEGPTGYTNAAFPIEHTEVLKVNRFLMPDLNGDYEADVAYQTDPDFPEHRPIEHAPDLLCASSVKVLGQDLVLNSYFFYDVEGKLLQTQSDNIKGGRDVVWYGYAFRGEKTKMKYMHCIKKEVNLFNELPLQSNDAASSRKRRNKTSRGGKLRKGGLPFIQSCHSFSERHMYDKEGRLIETFLKVDGEPELRTAAYAYNDLGQLIRKDLHTVDTAAAQEVNYAYDIHGTLKSVNDDQLSDKKDLFGMGLYYDEGHAGLFAQPRHDGNIAAKVTVSAREKLCRGFAYSYDDRNRFRDAYYAASVKNTNVFQEETNRYDAHVFAYDRNGNLLQLSNAGKTGQGTYGAVDGLEYVYKGNRLLAVTDEHKVQSGAADFADGFAGDKDNPDYLYDADGNLTEDKNKSLKLSYNFLNLPQSMTGPQTQVYYTYDAGGTKLHKSSLYGGAWTYRTYIGPFEYENDTLQTLTHSEGFVRYAYKDGKAMPQYRYRFTDQLGSTAMIWQAGYAQDTTLLCTLEKEKEEEGDYPKFKNVDDTRNTEQAQEGQCSAKLVHEQGPLVTLPVRHGQKLETSVWYYYEPEEDVIVIPLKSEEGKKKRRFPFGIGLSNQARLPDTREGRKGKNQTPVLSILGTLPLPKQQQQDFEPIFPYPNAALKFVLKDANDNVLHTEVKSVGVGGSWAKLAHDYTVDLSKTEEKEGKLSIFVENEEEKRPVWFDSLCIRVLKQSPEIVQENHYTPWGNDIPDLAYYAGADTSDYLYNGKELEKATNYLEYGWRQYDAQIGRFFAQDRFSEKYYPLSPYQYAANNPINYIDINGDSIFIAHKGNNYLYENGKLSLNGEEYKGKVKGFLKQSVKALGKIGGTKEGGAMLGELQSSSNSYTIMHSSLNPAGNRNEFAENNTLKGYANQLQTDPSFAMSYDAVNNAGVDLSGGSGGTIYWDPSGSSLPTTSGMQLSAATDLGHELYHGLDANRGLLDNRLYLGIKRNEWQATYRENMTRLQLGLPLRSHYQKLVSETGEPLGGTGTRMITPANQPLLPSWYKP